MAHIRDKLVLIRREVNICFLISCMHVSTDHTRRFYLAIHALETVGLFLGYNVAAIPLLVAIDGYNRIHELLLQLIERDYHVALRDSFLVQINGKEFFINSRVVN